MDISICSYSFHRLLKAGKQDMFQYIKDCQDLGVSHLEPWNGHFYRGSADEDRNIHRIEPPRLDVAEDAAFIDSIKKAADEAGMPFGCIAVDGAHIYEDDPADRKANRERASLWLDVSAKLGSKQMRVDSGHRDDNWPDDVFQTVVDGYKDLIEEAESKGVEIVIENHWGPSKHPHNVLKLLEAVPGLGLLLDTNNWAEGERELGWELCAKYATATHVKTFSFDENGDDPSVDLPKAMHTLVDAGYDGIWGIESVPRDGNEIEGARKTIALIKRVLSE